MSGAPRANRFGLVLFAIYCVSYATFVLVAAFGTFENGVATGGLARTVEGLSFGASPGVSTGVSWGIVGGFGLIIGAFLLALVYAVFARNGGGDA